MSAKIKFTTNSTVALKFLCIENRGNLVAVFLSRTLIKTGPVYQIVVYNHNSLTDLLKMPMGDDVCKRIRRKAMKKLNRAILQQRRRVVYPTRYALVTQAQAQFEIFKGEIE